MAAPVCSTQVALNCPRRPLKKTASSLSTLLVYHKENAPNISARGISRRHSPDSAHEGSRERLHDLYHKKAAMEQHPTTNITSTGILSVRIEILEKKGKNRNRNGNKRPAANARSILTLFDMDVSFLEIVVSSMTRQVSSSGIQRPEAKPSTQNPQRAEDIHPPTVRDSEYRQQESRPAKEYQED